MRILFLYMFPLWGNGSGSFLRELSRELIKKGHTIAIVAPDKRKLPGVVHFTVKPPQNGVFVAHPELPNAKKFGDMNGKELGEIYASYLKTTIEAVADFNPEIIQFIAKNVERLFIKTICRYAIAALCFMSIIHKHNIFVIAFFVYSCMN